MEKLCRLLASSILALTLSTLLAQDSPPANADSAAQGSNKTSKGGSDKGSSDQTQDTSDSSQSKDDKSDAGKTAFDEKTYAQATALSYRSMQEASAIIAAGLPSGTKEVVIYDPTLFAAINEYRIIQPQIGLLKKSLCIATGVAHPTSGPGFLAGGLDTVISGSIAIVDKLLKMMQTATTNQRRNGERHGRSSSC